MRTRQSRRSQRTGDSGEFAAKLLAHELRDAVPAAARRTRASSRSQRRTAAMPPMTRPRSRRRRRTGPRRGCWAAGGGRGRRSSRSTAAAAGRWCPTARRAALRTPRAPRSGSAAAPAAKVLVRIQSLARCAAGFCTEMAQDCISRCQHCDCPATTRSTQSLTQLGPARFCSEVRGSAAPGQVVISGQVL